MVENIDIQKINSIAKKAGDEIMKIYQQDFDVDYKKNNSPLTKADIHSNEVIIKNLENLYPDIPILSEENNEIPYKIRKNWDYFWIIDPLDGTEEFVKKNGEFTVNIALIYKNMPILGVIYAPVLNYYAMLKKTEGHLSKRKIKNLKDYQFITTSTTMFLKL